MIQELLRQQKDNYKPKASFPKQVFKWIKIILFVFLLTMSLWGCFQQFVDSSITTTSQIGSGFEICSKYDDCFNTHFIDPKTGYEYKYTLVTNWAQAWNFGPFYGIFVYPLAVVCLELLHLIKIAPGFDEILVIFIIVLIIRGLSLLVTFPQVKKQTQMQKLQGKISEIKAKYSDKKDMQSRQKQQYEIMNLYKKHDIKPFSSMASIFITIPFFYAMYRVFSSVHDIKVAHLFAGTSFDISFNTTIFSGLFSGPQWQYLIIAIIAIPIQIVSIKLPTWISNKQNNYAKLDQKTKAQYKTTRIVTTIMALFFAFISLNVQVALTIYWIFSGIFTILQTYFLFKIKNKKSSKNA